jgi:hypothetical protein
MNEQEIIDNAPKGATLTCTICEDKQRLYIDNADMLANGLATFWAFDENGVREFDPESRYTSFNDDLQSLADIKELVELRNAVIGFQVAITEQVKHRDKLESENRNLTDKMYGIAQELFELRKANAELEKERDLMLHEVANQYNGSDSTEWSIGANHVFKLFAKWAFSKKSKTLKEQPKNKL